MNKRTGKLSKRDVESFERVCRKVNDWIDFQESKGIDADNDATVNSACIAACGLNDFLYYLYKTDE